MPITVSAVSVTISPSVIVNSFRKISYVARTLVIFTFPVLLMWNLYVPAGRIRRKEFVSWVYVALYPLQSAYRLVAVASPLKQISPPSTLRRTPLLVVSAPAVGIRVFVSLMMCSKPSDASSAATAASSHRSTSASSSGRLGTTVPGSTVVSVVVFLTTPSTMR